MFNRLNKMQKSIMAGIIVVIAVVIVLIVHNMSFSNEESGLNSTSSEEDTPPPPPFGYDSRKISNGRLLNFQLCNSYEVDTGSLREHWGVIEGTSFTFFDQICRPNLYGPELYGIKLQDFGFDFNDFPDNYVVVTFGRELLEMKVIGLYAGKREVAVTFAEEYHGDAMYLYIMEKTEFMWSVCSDCYIMHGSGRIFMGDRVYDLFETVPRVDTTLEFVGQSDYNPKTLYDKLGFNPDSPITWWELSNGRRILEMAEEFDFVAPEDFDYDNFILVLSYGRQIVEAQLAENDYGYSKLIFTFGEEDMGNQVFFYKTDRYDYAEYLSASTSPCYIMKAGEKVYVERVSLLNEMDAR